MKLLFFLSSLSSGGAERVCSNFANRWADRGWDITIVTIFGTNRDFYPVHSSVRRIALDLGIDSKNIAMTFLNNWHRIRALRAILRSEKPDIALSLMDRNNVLLALSSFGLRNLTIIGSERIHPPREPQSILLNILRKFTYGRLHAMVVMTKETANWVKENTFSSRIEVIPNPVFWPLTGRSPVVPPPEKRSLRLLAVGRLVRQKQFEALINAFSALLPGYPEWDLIIVGEGPERERLEALITERKCGDRISLPGRVGNIGDWYRSADLYVMTSLYEGFGNSLVEAMAFGLPVISFDCDTGPRDIIRHEIDGLLVPPGDVAALQTALSSLMSNPALRAFYAQNALSIHDRLSIDGITAKWENLFADLTRI